MSRRGSPRSSRSKSGGRSPRGRRKKHSDDEADSDEEDMVLTQKWEPPDKVVLKAMARGCHFHIKDFILGPCIGRGTFASVRSVTIRHSEDLDPPPLALKIMPKSKLLDTNQVEHIKMEKKLMAELDSPFIVTYLTCFQDERRVFFLMEYVHAGDLFNRMKHDGRLPVDQAKFYAAEILLGLECLFRFNVAYRDLKPENVLLNWKGHVKLCDFGFAKVVKSSESTYTLVGTPEYLAPEIIQSSGHGQPVDYWALGVVIYEMLAGYPPFYDKSPFQIYYKILHEPAVHPRHFDVKANDLLNNLMHHNATERYNHIDSMMHCWFDFVDWKQLEGHAVRPLWRPKLEGPRDTEHFELVPDDDVLDEFDDCPPITNKSNKLFTGYF